MTAGYPTERASYGRQTACLYCGHDVEWHGKPYRRELVPARGDRPAVTMVDGGWMDRGAGRFCHGTRRLHRGNLS